jgi:hypothetical protein
MAKKGKNLKKGKKLTGAKTLRSWPPDPCLKG